MTSQEASAKQQERTSKLWERRRERWEKWKREQAAKHPNSGGK
jgi:hypothetical protein